MERNYPKDLYDYCQSNPSLFEKKVDSMKQTVNFALMAVCVMLIIYPTIIPVAGIYVIIVAAIGFAYSGFSALWGNKKWHSIKSGGVIKAVAIKKFALPENGTVPEVKDNIAIMNMFNNGDWEGLANEPEASDSQLHLFIHEDATGNTFYLQLIRYFSASDFRGVTEVKTIKDQEYLDYFQIIKSIKPARKKS